MSPSREHVIARPLLVDKRPHFQVGDSRSGRGRLPQCTSSMLKSVLVDLETSQVFVFKNPEHGMFALVAATQLDGGVGHPDGAAEAAQAGSDVISRSAPCCADHRHRPVRGTPPRLRVRG